MKGNKKGGNKRRSGKPVKARKSQAKPRKRESRQNGYIDYLEAIANFKDVTARFSQELENDHIIVFCLSDDKDSIIITATDGIFHCWVKDLDFNRIQKMRDDLGIKGTFESLLEYMNRALATGSFKLWRREKSLVIDLYFTLTHDVNLKSVIELKDNYARASAPDKFGLILQQTLFAVD
jgi:hypothetical protein